MNIQIERRDVLWSYLGIIVSMASNLFLLPLYVFYMDGPTLGLWYIFISIGSIGLLFDFGFSVTFSRNVTYCWSGATSLQKNDAGKTEGDRIDYHLLKAVLTTCRFIYGVIGAVAFLLLIGPGTFYIDILMTGIPKGDGYIAWGVYATAICMNLYYGYYLSFLRGVGAVASANRCLLYARLLQFAVTAVLLVFGAGIIGASLGYLAYCTCFKFMAQRRFYSHSDVGEHLKREGGTVTVREIKNMFLVVGHNAWRDGIVGISNYLSVQAGTIIASAYVSLSETGIYSIAVQLATALAVISSTLYYTYQPVLQEAYLKRAQNRLKEVFSFSVFVYIVLFFLGTAGLLFAGIPIFSYVKPEAKISAALVAGAASAQFILYLRNCYTSYFSSTNRIIYVRSFLLSSVMNVVLSIGFIEVFDMGVWGLIVGQIVSQCAFNLWYWILRVNRELGLTFLSMLNIGYDVFIGKIWRRESAW